MPFQVVQSIGGDEVVITEEGSLEYTQNSLLIHIIHIIIRQGIGNIVKLRAETTTDFITRLTSLIDNRQDEFGMTFFIRENIQ